MPFVDLFCVLIVNSSSPPQIFCLIHKMDLIPEDQRDMIFSEREAELKRRSHPLEATCFKTSIWDETLYKVRDDASPLANVL